MSTAEPLFEKLDRPSLDGLTLDYVMLALGIWSMTGVVLDIQKHKEGFNFAEEGFLTPEHAMFYTGFLGVFVVLLSATYLRRVRGRRSWYDAIPPGYEVGVVGIVLFSLGGPGDALWHSLYGAEGGIEALVSPTHLLLAIGGAMMISSPIRAAWRRRMSSTWRSFLPLVFSVGGFLIFPSSFTLYAHPFVVDAGTESGEAAIAIGLGAFIVQASILVAVLVPLVRRFDLPTGSFSVIFGIVGLSMAALSGTALAALPYLAAGLVADGFGLWMAHPSPSTTRLRLFGATVPVVWAATYVGIVMTEFTLEWTVHVWTGAIVLSGLAGLALTYVAVPSVRGPETEGSAGAM
jgi:hypothetical protein